MEGDSSQERKCRDISMLVSHSNTTHQFSPRRFTTRFSMPDNGREIQLRRWLVTCTQGRPRDFFQGGGA